MATIRPPRTVDNHDLLQNYDWQGSTSAIGILAIGPAGAMFRCERCGHVFEHGKSFTGTIRCVRCLKATSTPEAQSNNDGQDETEDEPQEVDKAAVVLAQLVKAGKRQTADQVAKACCSSPRDAPPTLYRLHVSWLAEGDTRGKRTYWEPAPLMKDLAACLAEPAVPETPKRRQNGSDQPPGRTSSRMTDQKRPPDSGVSPSDDVSF